MTTSTNHPASVCTPDILRASTHTLQPWQRHTLNLGPAMLLFLGTTLLLTVQLRRIAAARRTLHRPSLTVKEKRPNTGASLNSTNTQNTPQLRLVHTHLALVHTTITSTIEAW